MKIPRRQFLKHLGLAAAGMAGLSAVPRSSLPAQNAYRKIDMFPHIRPKKFHQRFMELVPGQDPSATGRFPVLTDLDLRFKMMDEWDNYCQVLTVSSPPIEAYVGPKDTPDLAKLANDELAELVARYPDRFPAAVACLPMNNIDAAYKELERAIEQLGLKGVQLCTNINGQPLDQPEYLEIFERMAAYDLPVWMHPHRNPKDYPDYAGEETSLYRFNAEMGWPFDSSLFMFRLVFSGIYDRHPNLKVIIHHMGAMIPYFRGRIEGLAPSPGVERLQQKPYEYFRMFYADTAVQGSVSQGITTVMDCGIDFFGPERVVYGTDMPYDGEGGRQFPRETMAALEATHYSAEDKSKMFEGNAIRLLKL